MASRESGPIVWLSFPSQVQLGNLHQYPWQQGICCEVVSLQVVPLSPEIIFYSMCHLGLMMMILNPWQQGVQRSASTLNKIQQIQAGRDIVFLKKEDLQYHLTSPRLNVIPKRERVLRKPPRGLLVLCTWTWCVVAWRRCFDRKHWTRRHIDTLYVLSVILSRKQKLVSLSTSYGRDSAIHNFLFCSC